MQVNQLQRLQGMLRSNISELHETILAYKNSKKNYDATGELEMEYACHTRIKFYKAELKKLVKMQMAVKEDLRAAYEDAYYGKILDDYKEEGLFEDD